LAEFAQQLAGGAVPDHPALARNGWWREPSRLLFAGPEEREWDLSAA
jgi:hypothetical protein